MTADAYLEGVIMGALIGGLAVLAIVGYIWVYTNGCD